MAKSEPKPRVVVTYTFKNTYYRLVEGTGETNVDNKYRREIYLEYSRNVDKMGDPIWLCASSSDDEEMQGLAYALLDAVNLNDPKQLPKVIVSGDQ